MEGKYPLTITHNDGIVRVVLKLLKSEIYCSWCLCSTLICVCPFLSQDPSVDISEPAICTILLLLAIITYISFSSGIAAKDHLVFLKRNCSIFMTNVICVESCNRSSHNHVSLLQLKFLTPKMYRHFTDYAKWVHPYCLILIGLITFHIVSGSDKCHSYCGYKLFLIYLFRVQSVILID